MENGIKVGNLDRRKCEKEKKGTGTWREFSGITGPIRKRKGSWEGSDTDGNWERRGWGLGEKRWELRDITMSLP